MKNLLSTADVARLLGVSTRTLYRWHRTGKLVAVDTDGHWRYSTSDVNAFVKGVR